MEIYFAKVLEWLEKFKGQGDPKSDRVGIYFRSSYLNQIVNSDSSDLVLGPYVGEDLDHLSVKLQYEYLQKAETFVHIPLKDKKGFIFAEMVITFSIKDDSISTRVNNHFNALFKSFPFVQDYLPFKATSLESSRIILKNLVESDAEDVFDFASNPKVAQFMSWWPHKNIDDSLRMIKRANVNYEKGWPIPLGIVLKDDPEKSVVGIIGLTVVSSRHRTFELVYALNERCWGKGILQEAAKTLIDFSFEHFAMNRLQCSCKVENSQSARVMEKLGMKYEGILRSYIYVKGEYWDLKMYSLLKSEHQVSNKLQI